MSADVAKFTLFDKLIKIYLVKEQLNSKQNV